MGLSSTQLNQLDKEMDANHQELLVMSVEEAQELVARHQADQQPATQTPQACSPGDSNSMSNPVAQLYGSTLHPFVNTNWGVPAGFAAYDGIGAYRLITDMGGYGTRVRVSTHNGKRYVIISGRRGTYRRLRGTRYLETNPRIVEAGIGRYGQTANAIKGFKLSCYVSVAVEVLEWIFNDKATMTDLFGGIGVELIKAGIASAITYGLMAALGTVAMFAAAPLAVAVVGGIALAFVIGVGLNALDNHYGIKQKVKDTLNYAVDRIGELQQELRRIDAGSLGDMAGDVLGQVLDAARETAVDYAKDWVLRRLPGGIPEVPFKLPRM